MLSCFSALESPIYVYISLIFIQSFIQQTIIIQSNVMKLRIERCRVELHQGDKEQEAARDRKQVRSYSK